MDPIKKVLFPGLGNVCLVAVQLVRWLFQTILVPIKSTYAALWNTVGSGIGTNTIGLPPSPIVGPPTPPLPPVTPDPTADAATPSSRNRLKICTEETFKKMKEHLFTVGTKDSDAPGVTKYTHHKHRYHELRVYDDGSAAIFYVRNGVEREVVQVDEYLLIMKQLYSNVWTDDLEEEYVGNPLNSKADFQSLLNRKYYMNANHGGTFEHFWNVVRPELRDELQQEFGDPADPASSSSLQGPVTPVQNFHGNANVNKTGTGVDNTMFSGVTFHGRQTFNISTPTKQVPNTEDKEE